MFVLSSMYVTCYVYDHTRPLHCLQIDGSNLGGSDVSSSVATLVNGYAWLRPLPGDTLRTNHSLPQVRSRDSVVNSRRWIVNNLTRSSCSLSNRFHSRAHTQTHSHVMITIEMTWPTMCFRWWCMLMTYPRHVLTVPTVRLPGGRNLHLSSQESPPL